MGARAQHSPAYRRLCQLLRRWRTDSDLTQRALASRLRKPASFVHKTEVGDRRIDPVEMVAWCRACEVDPLDAMRELVRQL
jgi:predicted transcriptional regulator